MSSVELSLEERERGPSENETKVGSQQKQEIEELDEEACKLSTDSNLLLSPGCIGLEEFCLRIEGIGHQDDQSSLRHSGVGDIWITLNCIRCLWLHIFNKLGIVRMLNFSV